MDAFAPRRTVSIAWSKLLSRPDIRLGSDGFWWLYYALEDDEV
jgi:hypothetical protein